MVILAFRMTPSSTNKAQTTKSDVENEQRIYSNGDAIFDNTTPSQNADAGGKRPRNQDNVDGDARDPVQSQR
jgi:hypothetical protein